MAPATDMQSFKAYLAQARHVNALCGAGISAASGIPTYRGVGGGGLWRGHDFMDLASQRFSRDPSLLWQWCALRCAPSPLTPSDAERRRIALAAKPNAGHRALASPRIEHVITQNVDGLARQVNAHNLIEMHGCLLDQRCQSCQRVTTADPAGDLCPALHAAVDARTVIAVADLPHCERCRKARGLLRPDVVRFSEQPRRMDEIDDILARTDLLLVIGTSSGVYPAAGFAERVAAHGGKVAVFGLEASPGDEEADWVFKGRAEETLVQALFV